jgi:hypothetical protein
MMTSHVETRKRARSSPDWIITFDDTMSLRCIVESTAAVMTRVIFKVQKVDGVYFLMVDGADVGFMCCVSARLQIDNVTFVNSECETSEFTFCVDCKQLLYSIEGPSCSRASLQIEGHTSDATIHLVMLDPEQQNIEDRSTLSTFINGETPQSLFPLKFKMILEVDLTKLRDIIKKARKAHAEFLRIRIFTITKGVKQHSCVLFTVVGDTTHDQKFCNEMTQHEDGSFIVRAAVDGPFTDVLEVGDESAFDGTYPIDKIDAFVKNMHVRMLTAKVDTTMPLMLTYDLGTGESNGDSSYIRFLVAPKTDDE